MDDDIRRERSRAYYREHRDRFRVYKARSKLRKSAEALKEMACASGSVAKLNPEEQTIESNTKYSPMQLKDARERIEKTKAWMRDNESAYNFIRGRAEHETEAKRHFSIRGLMHEARAIDFTDANGEGTKISNGLSAYLVRHLCDEIDGMRDYVEMRPSPVDAVLAEERGVA